MVIDRQTDWGLSSPQWQLNVNNAGGKDAVYALLSNTLCQCNSDYRCDAAYLYIDAQFFPFRLVSFINFMRASAVVKANSCDSSHILEFLGMDLAF